MSGFSLATTMDAIAITIRNAGLSDNAFPYFPKSITPPCVVVNYPPPGDVEFNRTFQHGFYRATFTVDFIVGSVDGLPSRDALSDILDGATSVAQVLEAKDSELATVVDTVNVRDAGIMVVSRSDGSEWLAARFAVEVGGR